MTDADIAYDPTRAPHRTDPYPWYRWSRMWRPVAYHQALGAWVVTRYRDVCEVAEHPELFSSSIAAPPLDQLNPPEVLKILAQSGPPGRHMVQADPPLHGSMRAVGHKLLTGQRIRAAEPMMRAVANRCADRFPACGDLVAEFSEPMIHQVLSSLVGIPGPDVDQVKRWNQVFLTLMTPVAALEDKLQAARQFLEYDSYLDDLLAERRAHPRNDVISDLAALEMPQSDKRMFVRGLYAGGVDTTKDAIGSTVLSLLQDRSRWEHACRDPQVIPAAFEETLRFESPHRGLTRLVMRDTELGGVHLPAGSVVLLLYGSANRDETVFPEPDEFVLNRANLRQHVAFGHGIHRCLGVQLARTEGRIALEVLTNRLPGLELVPGPLIYSPAYFFRGLLELMVRQSGQVHRSEAAG